MGTVAVQDDVAAPAFAVGTGLGPAQIRAGGRRAAEAGRRYMRTTISESQATRWGVRYVAYGPGGFVRQMALQVSWAEVGGGCGCRSGSTRSSAPGCWASRWAG